MPKRTKGGPFGIFNIHSLAKHQKKLKFDPLVKKKFEKSLTMPFIFQFLVQMIQFDTIKIRRTFQNYFGQFVWIEKSHYRSRVSLHEAPTKNQAGTSNSSQRPF